MEFMLSGGSQARTAKVAMAWALGVCALTGAVHAAEAEPAGAPPVMLNEVLFEPVGTAGNEGSWQWGELAAPAAFQLSSEWTLHDARGELLAIMPDAELSPREFLVVLLGPKDSELDNLDPEVGALTFTAGLAWADHVGVEYGGVQLRHLGVVVDEIYWGGYPDAPHFSLEFSRSVGT